MDTTQTTHLSLCSGYGGIDLGLRRAIPNLRTIAYAEIEAFACENLLARMEGGQLDPAPIWPDLKTFPWGAFSDRVDILSGGYPCQPFSAAGKRLGTDDPRHLWPFIANGIRILRPRLCFFENVEGHISLGLREVIGELESMGYKVSWGIFSAREVGAPHQRKRVFILAHSDRERGQLSDWWRKSAEQMLVSNGKERSVWPSRPGQPQHGWEPPRVVANSASERTNAGQQLCGEECGQGRALPLQPDDSGESMGNADCFDRGTSASGRIDDTKAGSASEIMGDSEGGMPRQSSAGDWRESAGGASETGELGNAEHARLEGQWNNPTCEHWQNKGVQFGATDGGNSNSWQTESTMGGNAYGTPHWMDYAELSVSCDNRTDELRLLGNGVVPATATLAFQTLLAELLNE